MCSLCDMKIGVSNDNVMVADRTPRIDIDLLDETMRTIEDRVRAELVLHPKMSISRISNSTHCDGWDQGTWRRPTFENGAPTCGTAMCVAGWAAHIDAQRHGDGGWLQSNANNRHASYLVLRPGETLTGSRRVWSEDGSEVVNVVIASARARRVLGLSKTEAHMLFEPTNTLATVRGLVANLIAEERIRIDRAADWARQHD